MASLENKGISTTDKKLYFLALTTGERLEIQFVPPELNYSRTANYASIQVIGRNIPRYQFVNGECNLSLELDFYADEENRVSVIRKCRWMEALTYNNGYRDDVQKVSLVFGDLFRKEVWLVKDVNYRLSNFNKVKGFMPQQANVQVTLLRDVDINPDWSDINPDLVEGLPDGNRPINLGEARTSDENNDFQNAINNPETFNDILLRAGQRLRFF